MKRELATLLETMRDPAFWNSLGSDLSISEAPIQQIPIAPETSNEESLSLFRSMLEEDGYFIANRYFRESQVDRLAATFDRLMANNFHPVYVFVFDEAWQLLSNLQPMFHSIIGDHYMLPAIWSWHVTPESQTAFSPHRDQVHEVLLEDLEHLDYLTVWIPLTDIDHRSSGIHLLPASLDPDFEEGVPTVRIENLQHVTSLQGPRGSVFCWSTQVAHWGTHQSKFGQPRKSIGCYLQKRQAKCIDGPPINFQASLSLDDRLAIIGQQIIDYSRTATDDELEFAAKLTHLADR